MAAGLSAQDTTMYNVLVYFSLILHGLCNLPSYSLFPAQNMHLLKKDLMLAMNPFCRSLH